MHATPAMPVLVVHNYFTMARILKKLLSQIGYTDVDDAPSAEDALQIMKQRRYGLIISDWNLEPVTGYELLIKVRADRETAHTPFILVTGEAKREKLRAVQNAGVSSYLIKPFSAPILKEKIESILSHA